jgi:hypothetical protein
MAKILVACPTADVKDYCFEEWVENVSNLTYHNFDVLVVDNSENREYFKSLKEKYPQITFERVSPKQYISFKTALAKSHDKCRTKALDGGYDYLLHLESDVFPPIDVIERLLDSKKPVIGALYHIELGAESKLMIQILEDHGIAHRETYNLDESDISFVDGSVKQVFSCGLGCILIHKSVLKKVGFRYEQGSPVHPDSFYFGDLNTSNIKVYVDTSIYCEHKNQSLIRI